MTTHAWMPLSPCVDGCIDPAPATVGRVEVGVRIAKLLGIMTTFGFVHRAVPESLQPTVVRAYALAKLHQLGIELDIVDERAPGDKKQRGKFIVAPHISWIDGLAISAVEPATFVGKSDIVETAGLKYVAKWMKLIPIHRESLRCLPEVIDEVRTRLAYGRNVAAFPEGTTWCGRGSGSFRPALFQAAVEAGAPVQPIRLEYLNADGTICTTTGFVGDDSIATSVKRLIAATGIRVRVTLLPLEQPGPDRRELATRCAAKIQDFAAFDFAAHGVFEGKRNAMPRIPVAV